MSTEEEVMTIQDGLSELKLISQKLDRQNMLIGQYSSKRKGDPEAIENQKQYVKELMQSNSDLIKKYISIKIAIQRANLKATFVFEDKEYSLAEALLYKQGVFVMVENFANSMNDRTAQTAIRMASGGINVRTLEEKQLEALNLVPHLFYSEEKKQKKLDSLLELKSHLDRLIDKTNHRTFIVIV